MTVVSVCFNVNDYGTDIRIADSLGGDIFYSLGLSLVTGMPRKPHWPIKTHVWVNAGQLDSLNRGERSRLTIVPMTNLL